MTIKFGFQLNFKNYSGNLKILVLYIPVIIYIL